VFPQDLLERYMKKLVDAAGLPFSEFLKLGRIDASNPGEPFNMAVLAMENANHVNGVSKLHAAVTRQMFKGRWPDYAEDDVPIQAVTNGIHTLTWTSRRMANLFDEFLGPDWRREAGDPNVWSKVYEIPDEDLWAAIENQRGDLVRFVRKRLQRDLERRNIGKPDFNMVGGVFDPRVLTIGFARRFATYKRATLMLTDKERLLQLLTHPERPIQIVIAGKSHPRDDGGKRLIQELVHFIRNEGGRTRMVFLEDYDMRVARALVQGVDVWLNNPRRPNEASGTSGMKVVPNGGLNCSILDGWWDEGYKPGLGFAIGDSSQDPNLGHQDWLDSRSLYHLIESEIAPKFYHRVDNGIPSGWVSMVKRSIAELAPVFSTARMVQEYTTSSYMPAAVGYQRLAESGLEKAKAALEWRDRIRANWREVRINQVKDTLSVPAKIGSTFKVIADVQLGSLTPADVRVEALLGKIGPNRELIHPEVFELKPGEAGKYEAELTCGSTGHRGYAVRILPSHPDVHVASELSLVVWS
jgi:starch phosphorylase